MTKYIVIGSVVFICGLLWLAMQKHTEIEVKTLKKPQVDVILSSGKVAGTFTIDEKGGSITFGKDSDLSGVTVFIEANSLKGKRIATVKYYDARFKNFHDRYSFSKVLGVDLENSEEVINAIVRIKSPLINSNVPTPFSIDEIGKVSLNSVIDMNKEEKNFTFLARQLPIKFAYISRK